MVSKKIADFADTISFEIKEDSAYGFINDLLISVYEKGAKKSFFIYYFLDTDILTKSGAPTSIMSLSENLRATFKKFNITDYSVNENGVEVSCILPYKEFYSLMKETSKILSSNPAIIKNVCSQCDSKIKNGEKRFRISQNQKNHLICFSCAKELLGEEDLKKISETETDELDFDSRDKISQTGTSSKKNEIGVQEETDDLESDELSEGSSIKGVLGALLLSLGGVICFILLYAFALPLPETDSFFKPGYYVNWISAVFGFASFVGYKIFSKQQMKNKQLIISGIIATVTVAIAQYISSIVLFIRELFQGISQVTENASFSRFIKAMPSLLKIPFTDTYVSPDFKIYLIMDIIFVLISLLVISFYIAPKTENEIVIEEI